MLSVFSLPDGGCPARIADQDAGHEGKQISDVGIYGQCSGGAGVAHPDATVTANEEFRATPEHEIEGSARSDVVDPVFVSRVVESLKLSQSAVLVIEQHARIRSCAGPGVLHGIARESAGGVLKLNVHPVEGSGRTNADAGAALSHD